MRWLIIFLLLVPMVFGAGPQNWPYLDRSQRGQIYSQMMSIPGVTNETIGYAVDGNPMYAFYLGNSSKPAMMLVGQIHGSEDTGTLDIVRFFNWTANNNSYHSEQIKNGVYLIGVAWMNIDWKTSRTRCNNYAGNTYGIDLNRNFDYLFYGTTLYSNPAADCSSSYYRGPSPSSEPESQVIENLIISKNPKIFFDIHTGIHLLRWNHTNSLASNFSTKIHEMNVFYGYNATERYTQGAYGATPYGYMFARAQYLMGKDNMAVLFESSDWGNCPLPGDTWGTTRNRSTANKWVGRDCVNNSAQYNQYIYNYGHVVYTAAGLSIAEYESSDDCAPAEAIYDGRTRYYISATCGSDSGPGSASQPFKTIRRLNNISTSSGSNPIIFLFDGRPGNVWRSPEDAFLNDTLLSNKNGNRSHWTTFGCYNCEERRPMLTGTKQVTSCSHVSGSLWVCNPGYPVGNVFFGNVSTSFQVGFRIRADTTVGDTATAGFKYLTQPMYYWQNRTEANTGDYKVYINSSGNPILTYNGLEFLVAEHGLVSGVGYFEGTGFQRWGGNGVFNRYLNVTGLHFLGYDKGVNTDADSIMIYNNTFSYIGGGFCRSGCTGFARWGNAIQAWGDADNFTVMYNDILNIYDAGFTSQMSAAYGSSFRAENHYYAYNTMINGSYCFEIFYSGDTGGGVLQGVRNITFEHNTCVGMGEGWSARQRKEQSSETSHPRHLRFGTLLNVNNLTIRNNVFWDSAKYVYAYQSFPAVPNYNLSNYSINYNLVFKNNSPINPLYNESGWFHMPSTFNYTSLAAWKSSTIHDQNSFNTTVWPFIGNSLFPYEGSSVCGSGLNGRDIGAYPCISIPGSVGSVSGLILRMPLQVLDDWRFVFRG